MKHAVGVLRPWAVAAAALATLTIALHGNQTARTYQDLLKLFDDFVAFERPPTKMARRTTPPRRSPRARVTLKTFQSRLAAIDPKGWPVEQQVDHALVRAEMNGLDFDLRVLRPWARDPAFYKSIWTEQSDTPAHEGPTHHAVIELWTYAFPLSAADERQRLAGALRTIPPLLAQARVNLVGNARDLWITGTGTMAEQVADLDALGKASRRRRGSGLTTEAIQAAPATRDRRASCSGSSGRRRRRPGRRVSARSTTRGACATSSSCR